MKKCLDFAGNTLLIFSVAIFFLVPFFVHAQYSGGGFIMTGSVNPVSGAQTGGGFQVNTGGNPAAQTKLTGGGFVLNAGAVISSSSASTYAQAAYYTQGSYGGGGGGGGGSGFLSGCTDPKANNYYPYYITSDNTQCKYGTTAPLTLASTASSTKPVTASCSIASQYIPLSYIRYGNKNAVRDVKALQMFLNEYEGFSLRVDGFYKKADQAAVIAFQERHADVILSPWNFNQGTGYVQRTTRNYIESQVKSRCQPVATRCVPFTDDFKRGDRQDELIRVQTFLKRELGLSLIPNGYFGGGTESAVRQFQRKYKDEVLTPAGFTGTTGKWASFTRLKANQLLGCSGTAAKDMLPLQETQVQNTPAPVVTPAITEAPENRCPVFSKDFVLGSRDSEILHLQEFLKTEVETDLAPNGYFGAGTKDAVVAFQEKYFADILAPGGYKKGTGEWKAGTRKKANELMQCVGPGNTHDTRGETIATSTVHADPLSLTTCPVFTRNFEEGMAGPEVQKIQAFLNKQLGLALQTNGYFGEGTKQGVAQFQEKYFDAILAPDGFSHGTGMWYPKTWRWANGILCKQ